MHGSRAQRHRAIVVGAFWVFALSPLSGAQTNSDSTTEEVTVDAVKTFLDPTVMVHAVDYGFAANLLPFGAELYTHRLGAFWAINRWTGAWIDVPFQSLSVPDGAGESGVGDTLLGWGAITHERLDRRFTTSVATFEALAPTGDPERGTGVGTWVLAPGAAMAFNPTDRFPVYVTGRYLHSIEALGGEEREER